MISCDLGLRCWVLTHEIAHPGEGTPQAAEGQVHLTAALLAAFKVVDAASFTLRDLKLA